MTVPHRVQRCGPPRIRRLPRRARRDRDCRCRRRLREADAYDLRFRLCRLAGATTAPTTTSSQRTSHRRSRVRIALVHNSRAGRRVYTAGDLVRLLRQDGSEVEVFARDEKGLRAAIAARPDVLVVSGGDGTVAGAAIALRTSAIPMYILPTGTSNNIARSVGAVGAIPPLVRRLAAHTRQTRLDIGRVAS